MNTDARPRILFAGVPLDIRNVFEGIPGTATFIDPGEHIHESDHDLLVSFVPSLGRWSHTAWHLLAFAAEDLDVREGTLRRSDPTVHAKHANVVDGLEPDLSRLVQRTIVEAVAPPPRSSWRLHLTNGGYRTTESMGDLRGSVQPLVHLGAEQYVYAFTGERLDPRPSREGTLSFWVLPEETIDHRAWLLYALAQLRVTDPERFPGEPDWKEGSIWAPPAVARADAEVANLLTTREQLLKELDQQIEGARTVADDQRQAATVGAWRLLTENDDPLVEAVRNALRAFGFTVTEMDAPNIQVHGFRLEDLRVEDPDDAEWEALVEVKGYTNGARVNDVPQIVGRPTSYFAADKRRQPRAVWHIVNVQRGVDPSLRAPAIPNDSDLAPLTDANGALIDTRDLFRAWYALTAGDVTCGDLRTSLRQAHTRWVFPVPAAP